MALPPALLRADFFAVRQGIGFDSRSLNKKGFEFSFYDLHILVTMFEYLVKKLDVMPNILLPGAPHIYPMQE